jgi:hypothetical protein
MKYNLKKKYQIAMRRLYKTNSPSKELTSLLGIDKDGFIEHINKSLIDGMTLDNFGTEWGLDHIVPVHLFDFDNEDELSLCYNFNNIMPMFLNDNRAKGASVHFSLVKLKSMYTNVCIEKLIEKCNNEIENTYEKYLNNK